MKAQYIHNTTHTAGSIYLSSSQCLSGWLHC